MTDITQRLRNYERPWPRLMDDAAAEIDRLRAEVELWISRWQAEREAHEATMKQADNEWR